MSLGEARHRLTQLKERVEALRGFFDIDGMRIEFERLSHQSADPALWDDPGSAERVLRKKAEIESQLGTFDRVEREANALLELLEMSEGDEEILKEIEVQLPLIERSLRDLEVKRMLSGSEDQSDAILSINAGTGGLDAEDWASMLERMYLRWAEKKGYRVELLDRVAGDGGLKNATYAIRGPYAYGFLRAENGVHRLIRISPFDANARRHTSFAAVEVVPELDDDIGEIVIRPEDLKVDTFRAGGKGGQHVNKTESAVRITHLPTGIVVACQQERSQHMNRAIAMKMLRGKLYELERQKREQAFQEQYGVEKMEIGFGSQVRTYTLHPYQLVKDERTEHRTSNANRVLDGEIDEFIEAFLLMSAKRFQERKEPSLHPS
ncbi:MAG: peptide chain release factor 2 [Sandaracinaceae bacterium]|nr:peptide chain release factor 2 [Sandaracinaceae bacterium]